MGKASSSKKVARAARTAGRPGSGRNYGWPLAVAAVVIVGVLLVVLSFSSNKSDNVAPKLTDHWHMAYGIYDCDKYLPQLPELVNSGIHTHGDGLIHVEPRNSSETGHSANLAAFVKGRPGMVITPTEIKIPGGIDRKNGDKCGDKPGTVKLFVWNNAGDTAPHQVDKSANVFIQDQGALAIAFVPDGVTPSLPPSVTGLQNPGESPTPTPGSTQSSTPGSTPTSTPTPGSTPTSTPTSAPVSLPPQATSSSTAPATTATTATP